MRPIPTEEPTSLGDYRRYPGCRVFLTCALCGWSKDYNPERIIDRLRALKGGGHATTLTQVARRVGWNCPGCGRVKWRAMFAWPVGITASEVKRLANLYRASYPVEATLARISEGLRPEIAMLLA